MDIILKIIDSVNIPIQVAGGLRTANAINKLLDKNEFLKIVIGTIAFKEPNILKKLTRKKISRVIISVDHDNENIMISGWKEFSGFKLLDGIKFYQDSGINTFLLTNINRDGTLEGPDIETLTKINKGFKDIKIISSGGISDIIDIIKLRNSKCYAVILGKALYDKKIDIGLIKKVI
jgi:phosphoribosylformimino-5-aminoimidazole carboxamide ribotide isomerase